MGELVSLEQARMQRTLLAVAREPYEHAQAMAEHLHEDWQRELVPYKPAQLASYTFAWVSDGLNRHRYGGRTDEHELEVLKTFGAWRAAVTLAEERNHAKLRTLFWAVRILRQARLDQIAKGLDREAVTLAGKAIVKFVAEHWGIGEVSNDAAEGDYQARALSRDYSAMAREWRGL